MWCPRCYVTDRYGWIARFRCSPTGANKLFPAACGCDCHRSGGKVPVHVNPFTGRAVALKDLELAQRGLL